MGAALDALLLPIAALLAGLLATAGTPMAIAAARRTGFLDAPSGRLKVHRQATPYLGGLAVFVPFLTAAALVFQLDAAFLAVLLAATLATLLGLMDDFGAMRVGVKFVGQVVIVLVLLRADVRIQIEAIPTWLNLVLTASWMLAAMNAVNFLDIMDGLAAAVALIASAWFLVLAVLTDAPHVASLSAALFGALAGYLRFSLPPARIFLGDAGSLFLGATLGALALALDYSRVNRWAVCAPLLVLVVPVFEITFTVIVRILRRRKPWRGSPDHAPLRLRRLGVPVEGVLLVAAACGVLGGAAALWLVRVEAPWHPYVVGAAAVAAVVAGLLLLRAPDAPTSP